MGVNFGPPICQLETIVLAKAKADEAVRGGKDPHPGLPQIKVRIWGRSRLSWEVIGFQCKLRFTFPHPWFWMGEGRDGGKFESNNVSARSDYVGE